jgi:Leucine-rich repeat (LRR) protein
MFCFRQNKLQEIPEGLTALHNLETLSLSSNEIVTLPTLIPPLTKSQGDKADEPDVMETDEDHITPYFPT